MALYENSDDGRGTGHPNVTVVESLWGGEQIDELEGSPPELDEIIGRARDEQETILTIDSPEERHSYADLVCRELMRSVRDLRIIGKDIAVASNKAWAYQEPGEPMVALRPQAAARAGRSSLQSWIVIRGKFVGINRIDTNRKTLDEQRLNPKPSVFTTIGFHLVDAKVRGAYSRRSSQPWVDIQQPIQSILRVKYPRGTVSYQPSGDERSSGV